MRERRGGRGNGPRLKRKRGNPNLTHRRRLIIPNPCNSDLECRRFLHRDIASMTLKQLWSERYLIEAELARRIYQEEHRRVIWVLDSLETDMGWLEDRLRQLRAEERRRRHAA